MRAWIFAAFCGAAFVTAAGAVAGNSPDQAVLARQSALKTMGKTFKDIRAMSAHDISEKRAALVADANKLQATAPQPWGGFDLATANTTVKNEALPAIWSNPADFKASQTKLIAAVAALDAAAPAGAPDVVEHRIADVSAACSGCHKMFKAK